MDRKITIEQEITNRSLSGEVIIAWMTLASVWASVRQLTGSEPFTANKPQGFVGTVFKIHYLSGLITKMRINYAGVIYDITAIKELGRREGLEISATAQVG